MNRSQLEQNLLELYHHKTVRADDRLERQVNSLMYMVAYGYTTAGVADGDPQKVTRSHAGRSTTSSFKKWVEWVLKQENLVRFMFEPENVRVEAMATAYGEITRPKNYTFEVVRGEQIMDAYLNGPSSCMAGEGGQKQVRFYADNQNVELVKISEDGRYFGRALLWTLEDGGKFLDRVYPSDGGQHTHAARQWAKAQRYGFKRVDSASRHEVDNIDPERVVVEVDTFDAEREPYLDSLCCAKATADGRIFLTLPSVDHGDRFIWTGDFRFSNYEGEPEQRAWKITGLFDRQGMAWDFVQTLDGMCHKDDLHRMKRYGDEYGLAENEFYCAVSGVPMHIAKMTRIAVRGRSVFVHPDQLMPRDQTVNGEVLLRREAVQLTAGWWAGLHAGRENVVEAGGSIWHCSEYRMILDGEAQHPNTLYEMRVYNNLTDRPERYDIWSYQPTNWPAMTTHPSGMRTATRRGAGFTQWLVSASHLREWYALILAEREGQQQAAD